MKLRFTAIAGLLLSLPLVGQAAIQVTAGSYNPTYTGASDSYKTDVSIVSVGGTVASASYLNDNGFTAFASPSIMAPTDAMLAIADGLEPADDGTGVEGGSITLTVTGVEGTIYSYVWYKDGAIIEGAEGPELVLSDLTNDAEGAYSAGITNEGGSGMTPEVAVTVITVPESIEVAVADGLEPLDDGTGVEGGTITLTTVAVSEGTLSYAWYKDGVMIEGATEASLALETVGADTEGAYSVMLTNEAGELASTEVAIDVIEVPVILTQATDTTATLGGEVLFEVADRTEGTASYTWYKDGVMIDGATSSTLALSDITSDAIGAYTLEIANEAGSVMSDPASLTGLKAPAELVPAALLDASFVRQDGDLITFSSEWFGEYSVIAGSDFGWVWTAPLGWTYFSLASTPEASYAYPLLVGGIFYITEGLYPDLVYSYNDTSWVLLNPSNDVSVTGTIWGWVYELNDWVEYSE